MNEQAKLIREYLDEVCDRLDRGNRSFRSWGRFKKAAVAVPLAVGLTLGGGGLQ